MTELSKNGDGRSLNPVEVTTVYFEVFLYMRYPTILTPRTCTFMLLQSQAEKFADYLLKNVVNIPRVRVTVDRMIAKRCR